MILEKENAISASFKKYIGKNLNLKKCNIVDPKRENYINISSISKILEELNILEQDYYEVSSISNTWWLSNTSEKRTQSMFYKQLFCWNVESMESKHWHATSV